MALAIVSETIDAPIERVWEVVADFGGLQKWNDRVQSPTLEGEGGGAIRTLCMKTTTVVERLEELDPVRHRMRCSMLSGWTMPGKDGGGRVALTRLSPGVTRVEWAVLGTPVGVTAEELASRCAERARNRIGELRSYLVRIDAAREAGTS